MRNICICIYEVIHSKDVHKVFTIYLYLSYYIYESDRPRSMSTKHSLKVLNLYNYYGNSKKESSS